MGQEELEEELLTEFLLGLQANGEHRGDLLKRSGLPSDKHQVTVRVPRMLA